MNGSDGFGCRMGQEDFIHLVNFMSHRCVSDVAWLTVSWCDVCVMTCDHMIECVCCDVSWHQLWNTEMFLRLQMLWIRGDHPHGFSIDCWRVWLGSSWKWWPHWGEQSRLGEQILQQTSTHVWFAGKLCNVSVKFFFFFHFTGSLSQWGFPSAEKNTFCHKKYNETRSSQ